MKIKFYSLMALVAFQFSLNAQQANYDHNQAAQAINSLNETIQNNPHNARAYKMRGNVFFALKEDDMALSDFDKVVELHPNDAHPYIDRAIIHYAIKNYNFAMKDIKKALEINPNSTFAQDIHDKILFELKRHSEEPAPKKKVSYHKSF